MLNIHLFLDEVLFPEDINLQVEDTSGQVSAVDSEISSTKKERIKRTHKAYI